MVLINIILLIISGIAKAVKDKLAHHFGVSIFKNLNPNKWDASVSHKQKWKNGDKEQGENFWLSSTILVGFTDWWHRFDMIQNICLFQIISGLIVQIQNCNYLYTIPLTCIQFTLFYGVFEVFYSKILVKK